MRGKILLASAVALVGFAFAASSASAQDNQNYCCWQAKATGDKAIKLTKPAGSFSDQTSSGAFEKCKFKAVCNPCNIEGAPVDGGLHYCLWQCKGPKVATPYTVTTTGTTFNSGTIETKKLKFILDQCTKS
jgi:hypothetical protein